MICPVRGVESLRMVVEADTMMLHTCESAKTTRRVDMLTQLSLFAITLSASSVIAMGQAQPPSPETPDHARRIKWFREAKFGLFIHWGIYSIPAGEWKGQKIAGIGEWIMNRAKSPGTEYEQLAGQFNPVRFNADEWVRLAKDDGMKYIVITSKHHDGFAMYHSSASKYNISDASPFKRDPLKEL